MVRGKKTFVGAVNVWALGQRSTGQHNEQTVIGSNEGRARDDHAVHAIAFLQGFSQAADVGLRRALQSAPRSQRRRRSASSAASRRWSSLCTQNAASGRFSALASCTVCRCVTDGQKARATVTFLATVTHMAVMAARWRWTPTNASHGPYSSTPYSSFHLVLPLVDRQHGHRTTSTAEILTIFAMKRSNGSSRTHRQQ